jgi:hypothetical protein
MGKAIGNRRRIPAGKTQVNFNISNQVLERVKNLAYWENVTHSELYNEKKHGRIKPIPPGKGFDNL